jgi:hypothetical protein
MSWSFVARNCRHVNVDVEPIRAPIFCAICLAVGLDLNSCDPFSRILPTSVESAACIVSFVEVTVVNLNDISHDN